MQSSRPTILPPATLRAATMRRLPAPGDVSGYVAIVAKLERDAQADATDTVRPGRVAA